MTKHRLYISQDPETPALDLWIEANKSTQAEPEVMLCREGENGKEIICRFSVATAARLINAMDALLKTFYAPIDGYKVEND